MTRRILAATDGTAGAIAAVDAAISFASTSGAHIIGPHLSFFPPLMSEGTGVLAAPESADEARERLGYVEGRAGEAGVGADVLLRHADVPGEAIPASARDLHCDLIVMGAHGRRSAGTRAPGSQTAAVRKHSTVPVLVVPSPRTAD